MAPQSPRMGGRRRKDDYRTVNSRPAWVRVTRCQKKKKKKHGIQPQRKTNSIGNCSPSVAPSRPKAPSPAPVSVYTKTGFALVDHQSRNVHCRAHNFSLCFGWRINGPRRLGDVPKATLMALPLVLSYVLGHMETLSTRPF